MRGRIWFAATAVAAASLAVTGGMAAAASPNAKTKPATFTCRMSLTTEPPDGSNTVSPPVAKGSQYGPIHCRIGGGAEGDSFTIPDSGDSVGRYVQYFNAGTIRGTFDLTPQEQPPPGSLDAFSNQTWLGTVTITGGTGVYKGIKSKRGTGIVKCTSADNVHMRCTEKVMVLLLPGT